MFQPRSLLLSAAVLLAAAGFVRAEVRVIEGSGKIHVDIDGKQFTEVILRGAPHVYYWPLIGPGGLPVTRGFPMEDRPDEEHDHPHHRSMWFSHGMVNGLDFWTEQAAALAGRPNRRIGRIVHDKVIEAKGGAQEGVITTAQNWVAPDGSTPVTSTQTLRVFQRPESEREFEFSTTLKAGANEVLFGDTKEGTFGIRIAETMRLRRPGPKKGAGHILNSEGKTDDDVWGMRAKWVSMSGPVQDRVLGIAVFDHPSNPRFPTRWHARDYGLLAANPFCEHEMDKTQTKGAGDYKLPAGESVTLRYRVLIHEGAPDAAALDARFAAFSSNPPPP